MAARIRAHAQQVGQFGRAGNTRFLQLTRPPLLSGDIGEREDRERGCNNKYDFHDILRQQLLRDLSIPGIDVPARPT
jgi:hypothetical protein